MVGVCAAATALQCNAGASRVAVTEHTAGWLAIEARFPEVEAESVQVPREQGRQDGGDQAKGLANMHHLKAYDHAWQAVVLEFASFVGKNKCVALKAHETRFTVPMSSLPGSLQKKSAGRRHAL